MRQTNNLYSPLLRLVLLSLGVIPLLAFAEITCHLHPAKVGQQEEQTQKLIGPFTGSQQCKKENARLFQFKGRCHCYSNKFGSPFIYQEFTSNIQKTIPVP